MGRGVRGVEFGVQDLGFGVWGSGLVCFWFCVLGLECGVSGDGFWVLGFGMWVLGFGFWFLVFGLGLGTKPPSPSSASIKGVTVNRGSLSERASECVIQ